MQLTRRSLLVSTAALAASPVFAQTQKRFGFVDVIDRAHDLSRDAFDELHDPLPAELASLDYDGYRKIRFRTDSRIELGGSFELDLFHRGHLFKRRVGVNLIRESGVTPVPYTPAHFDFGGQKIGPFAPGLGFAGIRVRYPLNRPNVPDELIVFLGASYFRFLARGQRYGLSARGLAIDAGIPGVKEEFPFFTEFWIEEAKPEQPYLRLHALLDSPSVAGAFSFTVTPGDETMTDVSSVLFPRQDIARVGLAPLTSMYLTGGSGPRILDLFRREVHDSDGLHIRRDGASYWRPLRNSRESRMSSFPAARTEAFGLVQRNRRFQDYQDLEAHYEMRPSYVVEPVGDWGPGSVGLSELTTDLETNDNIVASFHPHAPLLAGERTEWRYRIVATGSGASLTPLGHVSGTLISDRAALHHGKPPGTRMYVIDFAGGDLAFYRSAIDQIEVAVHTTNGSATAESAAWNPHGPGLRVRIFAHVEIGQETDISVALFYRGKPLSETWLARWRSGPERDQELASGTDVR